MGLGKTVQIITLLSHLSVFEGARPFLVTVPNSTIGNCTSPAFSLSTCELIDIAGVREFAKWAPHLRVVPYMVGFFATYRCLARLTSSIQQGDATSRKIIEEYEMFDDSGKLLKTRQYSPIIPPSRSPSGLATPFCRN